MSKWEEVAKLFDLELNEGFHLSGGTDRYVFTENGLMFRGTNKELIEEDLEIFVDLLNGKYEIEKAPWKPKRKEYYWFYSITDESPCYTRWQGETGDFNFWKAGNCFRTKEEAETKGKEIAEKIKREYEES